jgi:probable phosphoglycerate mutase
VADRPEVVLVRHGETEWSRTGRHTGKSDIPLTDKGREQARLLGHMLGGRHFARLLTSPLQRASETSRLAGLGEVAEECPDLREWDYGDYEGRTTADIRREVAGWTVWSHPVTGGETADAVGRRAALAGDTRGHEKVPRSRMPSCHPLRAEHAYHDRGADCEAGAVLSPSGVRGAT